MNGGSESRETRTDRDEEMRMFGHLESELSTAYSALSSAEFHAKRLGMEELAKMLRGQMNGVIHAAYGECDPEIWKKYEGDCDDV